MASNRGAQTMTKKWSSTRSGDGKTKRQASKGVRAAAKPSTDDDESFARGKKGDDMSKLSKARRAEQEDIDRRAADADSADALNAAELAIEEYYNGDGAWAVAWLTRAFLANKETT
jgi:hypothetical protein